MSDKRTLTADRKAAMQRGRVEKAKERQEEGYAVVNAFERWSANGGNAATMPRCPTDAQWRATREAEKLLWDAGHVRH